MSKDPFYDKILEGLAGPLNPQDFEDCMADLLRDTFPGLVPVHGGKDSGMDGAIADGEGEPFPLVTTTTEDVERNLKGSLDSFLKRQQPPRKVAFATSQSLTPPRRLNLMDLARERGFTLVQIIDQRGVADRLYRDTVWCKKLLGLSGRTSALSVIPASSRPLVDLEPVGRDQDLEWLKQSSGDRVLSGEPGSGKTFLLYHLAREGWGLFLVDPEGDIAGALREQGPSVVIVDDAHGRLETLVKLRHLRQETKAEFSIVATTWKWEKDEVIDALGIGDGQVHTLELLTRDEIVEVYHRLGIQEDPGTMRYLVDQAANKPGLAATIGTFWLQGEWQDVISGKALSRTLLTFFQRNVGPKSTDLLAAFGLGGDRGLEVGVVREFLGLSRIEMRRLADGLAAGGVLAEVDRDVWAVWPRPLRFALIRTVFFSPSTPGYRYEKLISSVSNLGSAVETLISAKVLGADIPSGELRDLVARSESPRAWNGLAQLSGQDARWVLDNFPWNIVAVGRSALLRAPGDAIERLLEHVAPGYGSIHSNPDHPMRILADWVRELDIPPQEMVPRRWLLARASKRYLAQGGALSIGVHGICLALSPSLESGSLDPGAGRTFTISSGLLGLSQLREVEGIWKEIRDVLVAVDAASWEHLSSMLWEWIYPEFSARSVEIPEEITEVMHAFAAMVLRDLAPLTHGSPGLVAGLQGLASEIDIDLGLWQDPDFKKLFPDRPSGDWKTWDEDQRRVVDAFAERLVEASPQEVARRLVGYEEEARRIHRAWPRSTPDLCRQLAATVTNAEVWLDAFLGEGMPSDLAEPFLKATLERQGPEGEQILERCLESKVYVWIAVELILAMTDPPPRLLEQVLAIVGSFPPLVETLCLRGQVSLSGLEALLGHPAWEVALAAAIGEWLADPKGEVREEIMRAWLKAILRSRPGEHDGTIYWFGEIFEKNGDLAFEWLKIRLDEKPDRVFLTDQGPFSKAIHALDQEQRIDLLGRLGDRELQQPLVSLLVDQDPKVYRRLLEVKSLSRYHPQPLGGIPDERWVELAMGALEAGYDAEWIAEAAFHPVGIASFWGPESNHWSQWDEGFAKLEADPRTGIQEIARHGRQMARDLVQRARAQERQEEIHGV
jgi:hypothetical protein